MFITQRHLKKDLDPSREVSFIRSAMRQLQLSYVKLAHKIIVCEECGFDGPTPLTKAFIRSILDHQIDHFE